MRIAVEVEACETETLPRPNRTIQWWVVGKSRLSSKCPIVHVQGKSKDVLAFLREHWGEIEDWGRNSDQEFIDDFAVPYEKNLPPAVEAIMSLPRQCERCGLAIDEYAPGETLCAACSDDVAVNAERASRMQAYDITTTPGTGGPIEATVEAINPLDALDRYAMQTGFSPYSDLGPLYEWVGIDQHGMWGVFTNYTIWAIPREEKVPDEERVAQFIADLLSHDDDVLAGLTGAPKSLIAAARASMDVEPSRATDRDGELRFLRHEGLYVGVCRDHEIGKLHVTINSEGVPGIDRDEEGDPFIEVVLDDKTIVDWVPVEGSRGA